MAYSGTTAASSLVNVPILLAEGMGRITSTLGVIGSTASNVTNAHYGGTRIWYYSSFETGTAVQAAGYFTDGLQLGMRIGDVLLSVVAASFGTTPSNMQLGILVTTNSTAGFNVAPGTAIQSS